MIPKTIFTIWLSEDKPIPDMVKTHILPGYEHQIITLENCYRESRFLADALRAKKWVKAADYLRIYYLYHEGGIYLDSDVEIYQSPDEWLDDEIFCLREDETGTLSNCVIGSVKGHPLLKEYMDILDNNFRGDGDLVYECGIKAWHNLICLKKHWVTIYPITNDKLKHYFNKSWVDNFWVNKFNESTLGV